MTPDGTVICRKCGWANLVGDRFCGSCSAFLEWDGEPAAAAADAATVAAPVDAPVAAPVAAAQAGATVADSAPASPVAAQPAVEAALVRCPACSVANPATRTFCQSCGTRLAMAVPITARSAEEIAAAVAAPHTPASPAQPATTKSLATSQPARAGRSSRGQAGWLVLAVLGIAVGVAVVLGANLLRGEGPDSGATSAPAVTTEPMVTSVPVQGQAGGEG